MVSARKSSPFSVRSYIALLTVFFIAISLILLAGHLQLFSASPSHAQLRSAPITRVQSPSLVMKSDLIRDLKINTPLDLVPDERLSEQRDAGAVGALSSDTPAQPVHDPGAGGASPPANLDRTSDARPDVNKNNLLLDSVNSGEASEAGKASEAAAPEAVPFSASLPAAPAAVAEAASVAEDSNAPPALPHDNASDSSVSPGAQRLEDVSPELARTEASVPPEKVSDISVTFLPKPLDPPLDFLVDRAESSGAAYPVLRAFQRATMGSTCAAPFDARPGRRYDTLMRLRTALQSGDLCDYTVMSSDKKSLFESMYSYIESEKPSIFMEFSGAKIENSIIDALSFAFPSLPMTYHRLSNADDDSVRGNSAISKSRGGCPSYIPNTVIQTDLSKSRISNIPSGGTRYDCFQHFDSVDFFAGAMFPFEFEEYIATSICRCSITWFPSDLPKVAYFAMWSNGSKLVDAAMRSAKSPCSYRLEIESSSAPAMGSYFDRSRASSKASSHFRIHRIADDNEKGYDKASKSDWSSISYKSFSSSTQLDISPASTEGKQSSDYTYQRKPKSPSLHDVIRYGQLTVPSIISIMSDFAGSNSEIIGSLADESAPNQKKTEQTIRYTIDGMVMDLPKLYISDDSTSRIMTESERLAVEDRVATEKKTLSAQAHDGAISALASSESSGFSSGFSSSFSFSAASQQSPSSDASNPSVISSSGDLNAARQKKKASDIFEVLSSSKSPSLHPRAGLGFMRQSSVTGTSRAADWLFPSSRSASSKDRGMEDTEGYSGASLFESWSRDTEAVFADDPDDFVESPTSSSQRYSQVAPSPPELSPFGKSSLRITKEVERAHLKRWVEAIVWAAAQSKHSPESRLSGLSLSRAQYINVYGRYIALLSVKLAKLARNALIASVHSDPSAINSHRDLLAMFGFETRNILCYSEIDMRKAVAIAGSQEKADIGFIQVDVVVRLFIDALVLLRPGRRADYGAEARASAQEQHDDLLADIPDPKESEPADVGSTNDMTTRCLASFDAAEEALRSVIETSEHNFIEMPSFHRLAVIVSLVAPECSSDFSRRYIAVSSGGADEMGVMRTDTSNTNQASTYGSNQRSASFLHRAAGAGTRRASLRIREVPRADRSAADYEGGRPLIFYLSPKSESSRYSAYSSTKESSGLSLYRLLHFRPVAPIKKLLFKLFIDIPTWLLPDSKLRDWMLPWNVFVKLRIPRPSANGKSASVEKAIADIALVLGNDHTNTASYLNNVHSDDISSMDSSNIGVVASSRTASPMRTGAEAASSRLRAMRYWDILSEQFRSHPAELADGKFSFVEHESGFGYLSALVANAYPYATVISLERDKVKVKRHVGLVNYLNITNNAVCLKTEENRVIMKNLYESPELFRYQVLSEGLLESFIDASTLAQWGSDLGATLSIAMTSFINVPPADRVSHAMHLFFDSFDASKGFGLGPVRSLDDLATDASNNADINNKQPSDRILFDAIQNAIQKTEYFDCTMNSRNSKSKNQNPEVMVTLSDAANLNNLQMHPVQEFKDFESTFLLTYAKAAGGHTNVKITPLASTHSKASPMMRIDIVNMTRKVHHHYDYSRDGHKRTYTMRVYVNASQTEMVRSALGPPSSLRSRPTRDSVVLYEGETRFALPPGSHPNMNHIVAVNLLRDSSTATNPLYIPYTSIYGVTLITVLRLGLFDSIRDRLFSAFLRLPLYEDMAPWNIVLMGQGVDYIDYDTRDVTFDKFVSKAYQVMAVLMNYKRTVEDFKRCGRKASTLYGFSLVSDCVGDTNGASVVSCGDDASKPVPCADGECHSDYISCLKSLSNQASALADNVNNSSRGLAPSKSAEKMLSYGLESNAESRAIAEALAAQTVAFNEFGYVE